MHQQTEKTVNLKLLVNSPQNVLKEIKLACQAYYLHKKKF